MNKGRRIGWAVAAVLASSALLSQAELVGEWNFDAQTLANAGTSGSTHDGTFVGGSGAAFSTDTISGSGYSLDLRAADDLLRINNSASGDGGYAATFDGAAFTVSMCVKGDSDWTKWDELGGKGAETGTGGTGDGWTLRSRDYTQGDGIRIQSYTDGQAALDSGPPYAAQLEDQLWHVITFTYDGSLLSLYADGDLVDSASDVSIADTATHALVFGAREDGTRGEEVLLDNLQFYDTALSAGQVDALSLAMIPEPATLGLVGLSGLALLVVRRLF